MEFLALFTFGQLPNLTQPRYFQQKNSFDVGRNPETTRPRRHRHEGTTSVIAKLTARDRSRLGNNSRWRLPN